MSTGNDCPCCLIDHLVAPTRFTGKAVLGDVSVGVTGEKRVCVATGREWHNSKDLDWRADARLKLNELLGNPVGTRLPGVILVKREA